MSEKEEKSGQTKERMASEGDFWLPYTRAHIVHPEHACALTSE